MTTKPSEENSVQPDSKVSVIMPVLNEERHLSAAVNAILNQQHDGEIEVILALGPSTDGTDSIAKALCESDSRVRLVANPSGQTGEALNVALAASSNPVVVRVDAHGEVEPGYIRHGVMELHKTGADNVGGVMAARGESAWEIATALAMTSRLGVGNAAYHVGGSEGPSASVYLGCFRRSALDRVGGFDSAFKRAQDWELNHRIRSSGGLVWFTPKLQVKYRPRPNAIALARQYFQYGTWRRALVRKYPETKSLRYLAAPLLVGALMFLTFCIAVGLWFRPLMWLGLAGWGCYLIGEAVAGLYVARKQTLAIKLLTPVALMTMHLAWGLGFITSPPRLSRVSSRT
jgi:glycosyltransferase involved in cell wall biosynthesis